jgi:hypothetical protein
MPPQLDLPATSDLAGVGPPPYMMEDGTFWSAVEAALDEVSEASFID